MSAAVAHARRVLPLVKAGRRVIVDTGPICADCGRSVRPAGPGRWRHVPSGRRTTGRSKWLAPSLADLRICRTYDELLARYPWTVASEGEWRDAMDRLSRYHAMLAAARGRRPLRRGDNPYFELVEILAEPTGDHARSAYWELPYGLAQLLALSERRRELAQLFAWAVPTDEALAAIALYAPLIECGAGTGYWAALLRARGVDVVAYDLEPPGRSAANDFHRRQAQWIEVRRGTAVDAVRRHPDRALVLCWPPFDEDDASYAPLRAYAGDVVIHVGEREGATGSVRFHRELALNWTLVEEVPLPSWPGLDDRVAVYRRNPTRRPHRRRDRCPECGRFVATGSIGRCDACFRRRPPALALQAGRHRVEYSRELLESMPPALRRAFESSPQRIR
jgi:hypothetical protein